MEAGVEVPKQLIERRKNLVAHGVHQIGFDGFDFEHAGFLSRSNCPTEFQVSGSDTREYEYASIAFAECVHVGLEPGHGEWVFQHFDMLLGRPIHPVGINRPPGESRSSWRIAKVVDGMPERPKSRDNGRLQKASPR